MDVDGPNSTAGNTRTSYGYDTLGLLASEVRVIPQVLPTPDTQLYSASYNYDPNGNRTSRTRSINGGAAEVDVYHYDHGDKLLHIDRTVQSVTNRFRTYEYNGLGETTRIYNGTTSAAFTQFNWNNDGRVVGMDLPGTTNDPTFRYNGFGTRIDRTVGANTEVWKRSGAGVTASVLNDGVANFTPGISSRVGSTSTFTHAGLKNTGAQSEFTGNTPAITGTKTYDAFGLETATSGTWKTHFGYAGSFGYQKTDAGMKLLGHRYYDPETGRFLSRDPIKDGRNWYAYGAGGNGPTSIHDATGLSWSELSSANLRNLIRYLLDTTKGWTDELLGALQEWLRRKGLKLSDHALKRLLDRVDSAQDILDIVNQGNVVEAPGTGKLWVWSEHAQQGMLVDEDGTVITIYESGEKPGGIEGWKRRRGRLVDNLKKPK